MSTRIIVRFVLGVFLSAQLLYAGTTGKISGKVVDSKTNEPIPFAAVVVVGTSLGASSDAEGKYVILNVPPGTYTITAGLIGYQGERVLNIGVSVDYTTTLNFSLNESSVEMGEVVVQGERSPLIRQDQTNPVVAVSSENIQSLPVTSINEIIALQAGVVLADDGTLHVRGGRDNEISYTLNGISLNNPYNNTSSIGVATNAVQEVSVSTGTFSAEYGNALSGVVNYVTKEGGPKYTGSARLLTGDYMTNHTDLFPHIDKIDAFNNTRVEATLGGPLGVEDLSFYASGVYDRGKGYLYGQRLYNPTDFFVTRDELNWQKVKLDSVGKPATDASGNVLYYTDPRSTGGSGAPYYFNPLSKDTSVAQGLPTGDGAIVPLNTSESYNIQANVSYRFSPTMKLKYEIVADKGNSYSAYYDSYRYNPDGRPQNFSTGIMHTVDWTHTISHSMFYTFKGSYSKSDGKTYAYESVNDPRYLPAFYQTLFPSTSFYSGGVSLERTSHSTETYSGKFDLVAQLFGIHEVKFGAEARAHIVKYEDYFLQFVDARNPSRVITTFHDIYNDSIQYVAHIPDVANGYTRYNRKPTQFSVYIQDKIEVAKSLILNAGLRFEYFDPNAKYNPNLSDAISAQDTLFLTQGLVKASVKQSLSPRISIAYPITDQGVIRFSYGHFYQFGDLRQLYQNPNFFTFTGGTRPAFGNTEVKPQRSVQYEMGLQQGMTPDLRLEIVGFYKDVRDYIFQQIVYTSKGDISYNVLTNLDYANSRGVTVSLLQRRAPGSMFSSSIDYTFAVAEGNRTQPTEDFFFSEKSGKSTETFLVPLSFDRTHTLNLNLALSKSDDFSISTVIKLWTGTPYTPSIPASLSLQQSQYIQNSAYKPMQWSTDIKAEKYFNLGTMRFSLLLQVDNLFDKENEISVYSNSGRALYSADQVANPYQFIQTRSRIVRGDPGMIPLSAVDNFYQDPTNISRPRLVRLGLSLYF
jgi:outer membrane receptor protein involved in Fe transport